MDGQCQLTSSLATQTVSLHRARLQDGSGHSGKWHSGALGRYQRPTRRVEALLASAYRAGTHPRRVKKAVSPLSKERSAKMG